jgi:hypothetical protein
MHFEYRYLYLNKSYLSFNRRYFRNQPIWNKNCLWQPCLLTNQKCSPLKPLGQMNRNLVGSIYVRSSIKSANFVPIQYCLRRPCLLMDRDTMSNCNRGLFIDASYQVSVHLAKPFQRRRFLEINQSETRIACGGHVCKCSPLKPLGQMNQNLVGSIYGRSSIQIAHFIPIR